MPIDFKLANILLKADGHAEGYEKLYYWAEPGAAVYDEASSALTLSGPVDFFTYVNACSACKWRRYAGVETVWLHVEALGSGELSVVGVASADEPGSRSTVTSVHVDRAAGLKPQALDIEVPVHDLDLIALTAVPDAGSQLTLSNAYWYAKVEPEAINPVRLALCTTTFNNERYILPNIDLVRAGIAAEGGAIASNFHLFVVDNGRTLDAPGLTHDIVTVLPNPNTGGAGGFARGMMAATEIPGSFTHVLLMDDDVRVMPESFIRTFNLLSLAKGRYRDAFINGAMLSLEEPSRQYEDVSHVVDTAVYRKIKDDMDVSDPVQLVENERIDVEVDRAYGAWWYSCIPVSAIEKNGLPAPFFIRCDDVEFGMRNRPVYMTMNGIGVWHASFEGRYRASVDCYQYERNFAAMIAMDDCCSERYFVMRLNRDIRGKLRDMDYVSAEFLLQGFEDYLKGPEFLVAVDGAALMKENGAHNEKLLPVAELDQDVLAAAGVTPEVLARVSYEFHSKRFMRLVRGIPYDKHYLPDFLLRRQPGYIVKNANALLEGNATRYRTLVFLDPTREHGIIRQMDRARFRAIRKRQRELMKRYRREGAKVRAAYKAARLYLTSREFWTKYLGL